MRVLITGAFGFVGTNLSTYLAEKGHELWALDVAGASSGRDSYVRRFGWDELELIPWDAVDAVVHLAGKAHDTRNTSDAQSYFDVNVGLTKKVLEAWQKISSQKCTSVPTFQHASIPVKKFLFFSSVKAVADRVEGALTEEAEPNPQTPYGRSKLEAEKEVLKCGRSQVPESEKTTANGANLANETNFRAYILRPCMIHGPGNKGNLNLLYGVVRKGLPWPLGDFENRRSFASIGNVCAAVEGLLTGDVPAGVYQVSDDEPLSTNELIALMAQALGRRARVWRVPARFVRAAARAGDLLRLPLNSERLKKLTESYVVSNVRLKRALGWREMPLRAHEGLEKTFKSFASHRRNP